MTTAAEEALAAVRRAAETARSARTELVSAMTAAQATRGVTLEAIGDAAGISKQRVHQIVRGGSS